MAKITFIGAGSLGFTRGLVRDVLTFPLLKDATITLMDINAERLEFAQKAVQRIVDLGQVSGESRSDHGSRRSLTRRGCRAVYHSGGRCGRLALRHRNPQTIRGGYQCRRYTRAIRHLPVLTYDSGNVEHRERYGTVLPGSHPVKLHQSDGDVVPGHVAGVVHPPDRPVP
jgi:hypothetical protein